jgi:glycerophosphoryl diester phosphodiesterase
LARAFAWLTARSFAHRGLHDADAGIIENTAPAFRAAVEAGYGVECDIHLSADGEVYVFHDETLDRLTTATGPLAGLSLAQLREVIFNGTDARIPSLPEVLRLVDGRVPLLIEVKSRFNGRHGPLLARALEDLAGYPGPVALMSFDPDVVESIRHLAPQLPRGIIADDFKDMEEWGGLSLVTRFGLRHLLHYPRTRPDFVAYWVDALPALAPTLVRRLRGKPLLTWTVRDAEQRRRAARHADQSIFEGRDPGTDL